MILVDAFAFGDSPAMADELLALVLAGTKTATTSWPPDPSVAVGVEQLILDGRGQPAARIRYTDVALVSFMDVGADFAAAEGEGDLSLEYWRRTHREYFTRVSTPEQHFSGDALVQCERFEVVSRLPATR